MSIVITLSCNVFLKAWNGKPCVSLIAFGFVSLVTSHIQCVFVCYMFTVFFTDVGILGNVCHNNSRFTVKLKVFRHLPQLCLQSHVIYTEPECYRG